MIIDIAMTLLLPLLMAYSLIGETFHEAAGTVMFLLFIFHHIINRRWSKAALKGRYDGARVFRTALNGLLFIFMILQPITGILLSKHIYTFLPQLHLTSQARTIHMLLAYWGYVLLSVHAGTHLTAPLGRLAAGKGPKGRTVIAALLVISVYGCYAFVRRGFPGYMTGRTAFAFFDAGEPLICFFLDYIAIMITGMMLGFLVIHSLTHKKK